MKLTKKDVGEIFFVTKWARGCTNSNEATEHKLFKAGRVNIEILNRTYRIISANEFSITASCGHVSDHSITIYRSVECMEKAKRLLALQRDLRSAFGISGQYNVATLSLDQLERIMEIINE